MRLVNIPVGEDWQNEKKRSNEEACPSKAEISRGVMVDRPGNPGINREMVAGHSGTCRHQHPARNCFES
jgi:hypothetical protein